MPKRCTSQGPTHWLTKHYIITLASLTLELCHREHTQPDFPSILSRFGPNSRVDLPFRGQMSETGAGAGAGAGSGDSAAVGSAPASVESGSAVVDKHSDLASLSVADLKKKCKLAGLGRAASQCVEKKELVALITRHREQVCSQPCARFTWSPRLMSLNVAEP